MTPFARRRDYLAWGRAHRFAHEVAQPRFADELPALVAAYQEEGGWEEGGLLGYGMGRSYGDSCLNRGRGLIDMRGLDRVLAFDPATGVLEAEAGLTLAEILRILTFTTGLGSPAGIESRPAWFLPVTPGTRFVTLGGAIANDVHGKNHHGAGCFGNHVLALRLLRSDGSLLTCSAAENAGLFRATIAGLGLTGLILSARLQLKPVPGPWMESEDIRYDGLDTFYELAEASLADWEYTVAWIDCLARGRQLGRGIFTRSRHAAAPPGTRPPAVAFDPRLTMPADLPGFALNRLSIAAFNALYWRRVPERPQRRLLSWDPVMYPLDAIAHWNRLYGRRGFYQYQCVLPQDTARPGVRALLGAISEAGEGSFLAVLKTLGDRPSPGLLSFPRPGTTLALDFPNRGTSTHRLLDRLDRITAEAGGRIYPAKDGRVAAADFQRGYPAWRDFAAHVDPGFSSSFWRRVSEAPQEREPA